MDQSARDDPKLKEVKAALHRLQGLPVDPESADFPPAEAEPPLRGRRVGMSGILIAVAVAVAVVALALAAIPSLMQLATSAPKGAPVAAAPGTDADKDVQPAGPNSTSVAKASTVPDAARKEFSTKTALEGVVTLMKSGGVRAARQRLLTLAADGSPDVLWALARSFDPTVHAAAVKQGLVSDSLSSLERIIGSMQRP